MKKNNKADFKEIILTDREKMYKSINLAVTKYENHLSMLKGMRESLREELGLK